MPGATTQRMYVQTPEFARVAERIYQVTDLTSRLNVLPFGDAEGRAALFAQIFAGPLPESVRIFPPFFTDYGLRTEFAVNVFVNQGCTFLDQGGIRIGAGVMIGPKTNLVTSGHPVPPAQRREYTDAAPIVLEENVWLGAAVTVLPGVTIGRNSVVGAGAVVTRDVGPNTLVTGPAAAERRSWNA
ncbi:Acetyltransferase (isoleucine patch superfamily) [Micromonospora echinospora]|uniref:Acetyltransferase (Isoleucine patch superfamily) n=1 Tax=Micromonospora echinospora TaxID=1877 RepID=A0A1C4VMI1_MICEC|nr:sugar O-acetyltransferase [Micromonospora echinospora]SCE85025.1 Acetyltransferase (isoleucine patch superfamily) [Micromonospora echinospora]